MANEFYYCVSLSIVHPTIDPKRITRSVTTLRPRIETMAGTERRNKHGALIIPHRKATLSHWLADLHAEEKLYSGEKPLSEFIFEQLTPLEGHRDLFYQLHQEGQIALRIGLFSISNYSAYILSAETLKKCGELWIDLEINIYNSWEGKSVTNE